MAVNDYYVDNNETIYVRDFTLASLGSGTSDRIGVGLQDVADLSGQSTWFVNHIRFSFKGQYDTTTVGMDGFQLVSYIGGVVPYGVSGAFDDLTDYLTVKGWPLKNCYGFTAASNVTEPFNNMVSVSRTYRPRKALLLNREQEFTWCVKNEGTKDIVGYLMIEAQLKRGD
jgi:hypothetical protein